MRNTSKYMLATGGAAIALLGGAGAALATGGTPAKPNGSLLADVASHLAVPKTTLAQAVRAAELDRLDARVAAGKVDAVRAAAIRTRIESGKLELMARDGRLRHGVGRRVLINASAAYLGMKPAAVRAERKSGHSFAQIAQAHGKTTAGLQQAIVAAATTRLDKAVAGGKLSSAREQVILQRLQAKLPALLAKVPARG